METKRILWMDITKALGLLIVLIVHAEISLGPVTFLGGMFYMPVFFVLSGMTFKDKPGESFGVFIQKKAKRLLLPYFGYNIFLFVFFFLKDSVLAGAVNGKSFFPLLGIVYSRNCLYPMDSETNVYFMQIANAPTWFLTGLFVSLVLFWWVRRLAAGNRRRLLLLEGFVLLAAILVHNLCTVLLPWSLDCALYSVAFLAVGREITERDLVERVYRRPIWLLALFAAFVGLSFLNGSVNMSVADYGRSMLLYLVVGTLGSLLCMELALFLERRLTILARPLAFLGQHTIPVLCLHLLAYSVIGTLLRMLGL